MSDSVLLKIDRAAIHIRELILLFEKEKLFDYVVRTDIVTQERSSQAKPNIASIEKAALLCGDAIHNLRTALDHAYWQIISPLVPDEADHFRIQFPFAKKRNGLKAGVKNRFANRAGVGFVCAILALKPFLGDKKDRGNELLYLIHELDLIDKHRLLAPTASVTEFAVDAINRLFPDIPLRFKGPGARIALHGPGAGFKWRATIMDRTEIGEVVPPSVNVFERKLDLPVDVVFNVGPRDHDCRVIPALNAMMDVTKEVVTIIRRAQNTF